MAKDPRKKHAPQLFDYYAMKVEWLPTLTFTNAARWRSNVLNTDEFAFRHSYTGEGRLLTISKDASLPCNIILGGSTAWGCGATSDYHTISSRLMSHTGQTCWNLGVRGYSSTQELLCYHTYRHLFKNVRNVILFSGVNDLALYFFNKKYPSYGGGVYYWTHLLRGVIPDTTFYNRLKRYFLRGMSKGDVDLPKISLVNAICRRLKNDPSGLPMLPEPSVAIETIEDHFAQKDLILHAIENNFRTWAALAKYDGFRFVYILQPLATWIDRIQTEEEQELFEYIHKLGNSKRVHVDSMNIEIYQWFTGALREICAKYKIEFHDMNALFAASPDKNDWLFVDRVHLSDKGYNLVAKQIAENIL